MDKLCTKLNRVPSLHWILPGTSPTSHFGIAEMPGCRTVQVLFSGGLIAPSGLGWQAVPVLGSPLVNQGEKPLRLCEEGEQPMGKPVSAVSVLVVAPVCRGR